MSTVRGTRGYLAPEWLGSDEITAKADVYSFGMLLLQLVRGVSSDYDRWHLREWAHECIATNKLTFSALFEEAITTAAPREAELVSQEEQEQMIRALKVGMWCVQQEPSQRPSMGGVVQMLEGSVWVAAPPYPAPLATHHLSASMISMSASGSFTTVSGR